jgi:hypothetical protein
MSASRDVVRLQVSDRCDWAEAGVRAHDCAAGGPAKERTIDERLDDIAAGARFQVPQPSSLRKGELEARHFKELAANPTDKR